VRIDSEYDDVDILKQSVASSTSSVCASVKVPLYPGSWMLKVRDSPQASRSLFIILIQNTHRFGILMIRI
jgi:hypothetical protein